MHYFKFWEKITHPAALVIKLAYYFSFSSGNKLKNKKMQSTTQDRKFYKDSLQGDFKNNKAKRGNNYIKLLTTYSEIASLTSTTLQLLSPEYFTTKFFYYSYEFHLFLCKNMTTAFFIVYFFQSCYTHYRQGIQLGILYIYVENYYACIYVNATHVNI